MGKGHFLSENEKLKAENNESEQSYKIGISIFVSLLVYVHICPRKNINSFNVVSTTHFIA